MFGNGQDPGAEQAQSTSSLLGDLFGVGSLFKVITDPGLQAHAHAMMAAVIEGANSSRRIEAKLDRLLKALGHEIEDINARFPTAYRDLAGAPLLEQHRADGAAGHSLAGGAPDDGARGAAVDPGKARGHSRGGGGPHKAGGA